MMMTQSGGSAPTPAQSQRAQIERLAQSVPLVTEDATSTIRLGVVIMILFFVVLGGWLAVAPLASASMAAGTIRVESHRQAVQHLEGGIVREILVREGQLVREGDVLIRLDDTQARAGYEIALNQYLAQKVVEARLVAERDNQPTMTLPPEVTRHQADPAIAQMILAQQQLFLARRETLLGQEQVLRQRIAQAQEQIRSALAQETSQRQQLALIRDELQGTRELFERGYAPRTRVLALERTAAALQGQMGEYTGIAARTRQQVAENEQQIRQTQRDRIQEIADQLRESAARLADLEPRVRAARDALDRVEIRAPMTGFVVGLQVFTVGGVVNRSERLLEVVPEGATLVVEAQLPVTDGDDVREGMRAELHLSSVKRSRGIPVVQGVVRTVSADRLTDQRSGMPYFTVLIEVNQESLREQTDITLIPGMPVDVIIPLRERSALSYLIQPLLAGLDRAGREQ
ncbi:MAG: HlyD family type I secretion periplasmic adaptor subunit [Alphaproteobacteria bacterium]|nr:HlyD family type I secretion periplasmic adaptor subunit [Alphaproteobacteria bacterium]